MKREASPEFFEIRTGSCHLTFFLSIRDANAATAALTVTTGPLFVTGWTAYAEHRAITRDEWLSIALAVGGVSLLVTKGDFSTLDFSPAGVLWGIASAACGAFCTVQPKRMLTHLSVGVLVGWGMTLGEALLTPTKIYVKPVLRCMEAVTVKGVSHITGGGFFENIPRCLPEGLGARIRLDAVKTPPIFSMIASAGSVPQRDMFNTFNMGVGMTVVVSPEDVDTAIAALNCGAYVIGEIARSEERVVLC